MRTKLRARERLWHQVFAPKAVDVAIGIDGLWGAAAVNNHIGSAIGIEIANDNADVGHDADKTNAMLGGHGVWQRAYLDPNGVARHWLNDGHVFLAVALGLVGLEQGHLFAAAIGSDTAGDGGKQEVVARVTVIESFFHNRFVFNELNIVSPPHTEGTDSDCKGRAK